MIKVDKPVKNQISALLVIPVKTGIQYFHIYIHTTWIPAYAGMTTFYEVVKVGKIKN